LHGDSKDLNAASDATTLAEAVNNNKWHRSFYRLDNVGQKGIDPWDLGPNGNQARLLLIDENGNWDISDNDFTINIVDATKYAAGGVISPNGGETWDHGIDKTITWDSNLLDTGWLSGYILLDKTTDLDLTNAAGLADAVNAKYWEHRISEDAATGSRTADPSHLAGNGCQSRLLLIDDAGNWDISDSNFTATFDDSPPTVDEFQINNDDASTTSTAVVLDLSATDYNNCITAYYASESSITPSPGDSGWTSISPTLDYSDSVSFDLSSGDGTKTVYIWFKDTADNVSNGDSDIITLNTSSNVPTCV